MKNISSPLKIMLAVDGSDHSLAAVSLLGDLPLPSNSAVNTVAVLVPRDAANYAAMSSVLEQTKTILLEKGIPVTTELLVGYPADELAAYADKNKPDLIIMGAKGLRATLGILLGGVAQQIVEYSPFPVLVVRAPYTSLHRILLVSDGSEHSQRAVEYMTRFSLPSKVEFNVMHVMPPQPSPALIARYWPVGTEAIPALPSYEEEQIIIQRGKEEEQHAQELLTKIAETLKPAGIVANPVLRRGDAATEIIDFVKTNKIDLIVVGGRGLSRLKGLLLGSLTRKLLHYAGCSVLVVKTSSLTGG